METLLKQLRELPARILALPAGLKALLLGGIAVAIAAVLGVAALSHVGDYQYAFTNLSQEDSAEASSILKNASIPFRLEANGSALAVAADKVYDARIMLATSGIPRGGGVGFELFDRGDLGVSEFTQKVNLRRATEGELARTIGNFSGVRSARVTVSLGEHGLYRDEDKKPSAAVVVSLQPGRVLGEKELAGVRHLVSSAVPGLPADSVTVMDGRGAVLSADSAWDSPEASYQRKLEREFEQRIITLLEPVVGMGSVVAKVTATVDHSQVNSNSEVYDPDQVALRSERKVNNNSSNQTSAQQGVAGAQANVPLQPAAAAPGPTTQGTSANNDEVKNYEITKTTTQTVARLPRLQKLSVAVMLDGVDGKPRAAEELAKLNDLARKAVGYDESRGDQFEMTSQVFGRSPEVADAKAAEKVSAWLYAAIGAGALVLLLGVLLFARRKSANVDQQLVLQPGSTVAALEAKQHAIDGTATEDGTKALPEETKPPVLVDPIADIRERARSMVRTDPDRAVLLVRSWLSIDLEKGVDHHG
jgi:flagellar M-ring protein FliF